MQLSFQILAIMLASAGVFASLIIIIRLKQPVSFVWWIVKVFTTALIPFFVLISVTSVLLSIVVGSLLITLPGVFSIIVFCSYFRRVKNSVNSPIGLSHAYGPDWRNQINPGLRAKFLSNPFSLLIPRSSAFVLRQDIPFCKLPDTTRELLCDVWIPAKGVERSGLAFIYFHGSAWEVLDKDFGTRPFFRHLVSQGHVIMDVAYRLFPETDMTGMVNDVYRAIAWMKKQAADLKIKPNRIVIGGGSTGAHLSMLAAYSMSQTFIPAELHGTDLSVHAVISEYGPPDLKIMYDHTRQDIIPDQSKKSAESSQIPLWVWRLMGKNLHRLGMDKDITAIGVLPVILGCYPNDCPEVYATFSPVKHVHRNCPQTFILQGTHDLITPVEAALQLYQRLNEEGVKVTMYLIPQTDHAFDLIMPRISPVAHTAFYLVERFLALQVNN